MESGRNPLTLEIFLKFVKLCKYLLPMYLLVTAERYANFLSQEGSRKYSQKGWGIVTQTLNYEEDILL